MLWEGSLLPCLLTECVSTEHGVTDGICNQKACAVIKLPNFMSFEEGCILPMSVATAGAGLFLSMGIPRPPAKQQGNFLVWGASSSVGSAAVRT